MASLKAGPVADNSSGGFSYAQAAKGRSPSAPSAKASSSSAVSGTATPASASLADSTPGSSWADDVESSGNPSAGIQKTDGQEGPSEEMSSIALPQEPLKSEADLSPSGMERSQSQKEELKTEANTPGSAESEGVEQTSTPATSPTDSKDEKERSSDAKKESSKKQAPPKPVYTEAKPPTVNVWAQRAAEAKAKAAIPSTPTNSSVSTSNTQNDGERTRNDIRRRSENTLSHHPKKVDQASRPREDIRVARPRRESRTEENASGAPRRNPLKPRNSEPLPSVGNEVSWPKPTASPADDSKRKAQGKDEQADKDQAASTAVKGRPEWKSMPYTPTAVFETQVVGKGAGRMGKGASRGGHVANSRSFGSGVVGESTKVPVRASTQVNGDPSSAEKAEAARADRQAMPPPPSKAPVDANNTANDSNNADNNTIDPNDVGSDQANAGASRSVNQEETGRPGPHAKRNKSPRKSDGVPRRTGSVHDTASHKAFTVQTEGHTETPHNDSVPQTPKSAYSDRRSDMAPIDTGREAHSFREGKRGRGKGARGAYNGHFGSPHHYSNGFQDMPNGNFGGVSPYTPRGGHPSQQSRSGYRNQGVRAQSIPLDSYGRQLPYGYPMMPMQPMADYYGPYPSSPFPFPPTSERDILIAQVLAQVEYYFSLDNLLKDIFLRKHMDSHGWIMLDVVAQFNRLRQMTTDYDLLRAACLQSQEIEIRVADDGKERLRKVAEWEKFVLPIEERNQAARSDPPQNLRRPSTHRMGSFEHTPTFQPHNPVTFTPQIPNGNMDQSFSMMNGGPPPFYPGGFDPRFNNPSQFEESRGRQNRPMHNGQNGTSPLTNGFESPRAEVKGESDKFPTSQIDGLTVVVRKHDLRAGAPFHTNNSRTFSNGSIDSRSIMEEVNKVGATNTTASAPQTNGTAMVNGEANHGYSATSSPTTVFSSKDANALTLFWVKDKENPVDVNTLPVDTTHEPYTHLRYKALSQRDDAATGTCPYDLDVLYQFWSHFLIRNFNSKMYAEFRHFANDDASQRHSDIGTKNLVKYYSEAFSGQLPIRDDVARDYAELIAVEGKRAERPAFKQLRSAWRDGSVNLKNRKKLGDVLDSEIKAELES